MALAIPERFDLIPPFKHAPLDHTQPSIRIMKVLAYLSPEGLVQCTLTHDSTDNDYTCLSYTWGDENTTCPALMNGQLFFVRQNLHNFLHVVRRLYPRRPFWIDAVCIDQSTVAERNHQVAQMGAIYTAAVHVIVWLGKDSKIAQFFRVWNRLAGGDYSGFHTRKQLRSVEAGWIELSNHAYWTRAWITQELANSIELSLMADAEEIHTLDELARNPAYGYGKVNENFVVHTDIAQNSRYPARPFEPLYSLLGRFPNRQCQRARDRVYSLLGLAAEGSNIRVDYDSSDLEFVLQIFKVCKEFMCLCGFMLLSNTLHDVGELNAEASAGVHCVRLVSRAFSIDILPQQNAQSAPNAPQTSRPILNRRHRVLNFELFRVCENQPRNCGLEVLDLGESGTRQQRGRFTRLLYSRYCPGCVKRGSCPSPNCACQKHFPWWPGKSAQLVDGVYFDYQNLCWMPADGGRNHGELCWYWEPDSERIVTNWFRVLLKPESRVETGCYALDIPVLAIWSYAHQSRAFKILESLRRAPESPWLCRAHPSVEKEPDRLCEHILGGRSSFSKIQKQTKLEDVWSCDDIDGFVDDKLLDGS